jgi:uncharacterized protein
VRRWRRRGGVRARPELVRGGHFDAYNTQFDRASGAALSWFTQHLA